MVNAYRQLAERVRLPAAPRRDRGRPGLPGHDQVGRRLRRAAGRGHRRHDPRLAVGAAGRGGQGRQPDPRVARPAQRGLEIVSCPSCGRAQVDVYTLAEQVTAGLEGLTVPLRVAVMGCVVNGPGEAREADLGVASGNGKGQIFVQGEVIKTVPESQIVETLIEEAMRIAEEMERRRRSLWRTGGERQLGAPAPTEEAGMLRSTSLRVLRPEDLDAVTEVLVGGPGRQRLRGVPGPGRRPRPGPARRRDVGLRGRRPPRRRSATPAPTWSRCRPDAEAVARLRRPGPAAQGRRCSSIVGPSATAVAALWRELEPSWGPAREVRDPQPLMAISEPPAVAADPQVRRVADGRARRAAAGLRRDVHRGGRRLAASAPTAARRTARGSRSWCGPAAPSPASRTAAVVFKAEIGSSSEAACQVQGVWVPPDLRGRGLAAPGMATVVEAGPARDRAGRQPLRQRLQRGRPGDLPPGRLHRRRRVHVRALLSRRA